MQSVSAFPILIDINTPEDLVRNADLEASPTEVLIEQIWEKAQERTFPMSYQVTLLLHVLGSHLKRHYSKGGGKVSPFSISVHLLPLFSRPFQV